LQGLLEGTNGRSEVSLVLCLTPPAIEGSKERHCRLATRQVPGRAGHMHDRWRRRQTLIVVPALGGDRREYRNSRSSDQQSAVDRRRITDCQRPSLRKLPRGIASGRGELARVDPRSPGPLGKGEQAHAGSTGQRIRAPSCDRCGRMGAQPREENAHRSNFSTSEGSMAPAADQQFPALGTPARARHGNRDPAAPMLPCDRAIFGFGAGQVIDACAHEIMRWALE